MVPDPHATGPQALIRRCQEVHLWQILRRFPIVDRAPVVGGAPQQVITGGCSAPGPFPGPHNERRLGNRSWQERRPVRKGRPVLYLGARI